MEIKTISYGIGAGVDYVVHDGMIFFCATGDIRELGSGQSVVNAARRVMRLILKDSGLPPEITRIFAILTHVNWTVPEGEYDFRELVFRNTEGSLDLDWPLGPKCPGEVVEAFRRHIGGRAPKRMEREDPDANVDPRFRRKGKGTPITSRTNL